MTETLNFPIVKSGARDMSPVLPVLINRFYVAYQDQFHKGGRILNTATSSQNLVLQIVFANLFKLSEHFFKKILYL